MSNYRICIPTYKRTVLPCLQLLKYSGIELDIFVRNEELESGFYDFLKVIPRVNIRDLGKDVIDIGDTRDRIMRWCLDNDIEYCLMLDDGVDDIWYANEDRQLDTVICSMITCVSHSAFKDRCLGLAPRKVRAMFNDGTMRDVNFSLKNRDYLAHTPTQAVLLDVKRCFAARIRYKTLDVCGFEDCAFYVDALKHGCVFSTPECFHFSAVVPNANKAGGNHTTDVSLEEKYDKQAAQCKKYIGNIYGIALSKRYRSYAKTQLALIEVDNDYFYEVLVKDRIKNANIIKNKFLIDEKKPVK